MTPNAFMRLSLPLFSLVSAVAASGQTAQRPARVEVAVPQPPVPVLADGKRVLVYELHVTNFGRGALGFREINVLNGAEITPSNTDGYDWHTDTLRIGDRRLAEYYAAGNGGQLLIIVPELELVVVFTAGNYNNYGVWRAYREEWLPRYIVPR